ncbi:MAG TPA: tRNA (cytidine(34)-2'-O)-methyltransferase [Verrucomicrobiae bacterium]|jgi:tRNA (cytidine/uridine-2'-O-)-methyltransferase|nr:tRNA (cytidine(34)-2'-O)-methyltransferase [Verrucomicrobiae bacterium]
MNVVLVEPEIPPNAGNVARLCASTRTVLHLVEPFGFQLDDARLKRAGMDYWQHLEWHRWQSWTTFETALPPRAKLWLIESKGPKRYTEARYEPDDYLVFGRETAGLPEGLLKKYHDNWLRIPMFNENTRSLNLANCAAIVLFEALRQRGFTGELPI